MADEIIRPSFGDPPLVVDETGSHCTHSYLSLRKRDKAVICRVCSQAVDPFDVLCALAREWNWATHFSEQVDERVARVEELKKEEQLIKARVRTGVKRAPEPRSKLFVRQALSRLESVADWNDLRGFDRWRFEYRWVEPSEQREIAEAYDAARDRLQKRTPRRRGVTVLQGGKDQ